MSDTIRKDPNEEKTVVVKKSDIEQQLHKLDEEKTVLDTVNEGYKSIFDPELEEILRETEGYELTPQNEDGEPEYDESGLPDEPGSRAEEIIREQAERREHKRKKKLIIICAAIVAALAAMLALILLLKTGGAEKDYDKAFSRAQEYYYSGDYDNALSKLREVMEIKKTDECLLLMSRCYEAKYDYVNAIAILESSTSGDEKIKTEIERLKKAKEDYDSGKIVVICGEQYDVETTVLDLSGKGAGSAALKDIAKLTELTSLKLSDNKISELDFLSSLKKLSSLDLSNNKISDISPLKKLSSIRTLHLDGNEIKDFSPLYGLDSLSMLTIGDMDIKQSQLKKLKEELPDCIIYSDDAKEDVIEIKLGGKTFDNNVTELDLSGCDVHDISLLSVCTKLKKLDLSDNSISDISALVDIPELAELDLSNNRISDISPLMSVSKLTYLNLAGNRIKSVAALQDLTSLTELNLSSNELGGIAAVGRLTNLKTLWLDDTGLKDASLEELYGLKNLKKLSIKDNSELSEAAVTTLQKKLSGCTISHSELKREIVLGGKSFACDAETVEANGLGLSDISKVSGFSNVKHLDLSNNSISRLSPLSQLKTLETLDLSNNRISDVSALTSLKNLKQLWLGGNSISAEQLQSLKAALPNCYISVE
mgnify:FL=1